MKHDATLGNSPEDDRSPSYRSAVISGFVFGAFVAPLLAILSMISPYLEFLKPLLTGPMLLMGSLIPNTQTGPHSFEVPVYKWIITLGFNGICYSILGVVILTAMRAMSHKRSNAS